MNKAILMGRLVRDPELRNTASGIAVCTFTLAVDRRFRNANGERQADFIPVVAWRQQAEFVNKYFRKGSQVLVCGSIQRRSWEDNEGRKRYETEVIADEVEFAEGRRTDNQGDRTYGDSFGESNARPATPTEMNKPRGFEPSGGDRFLGASDDDTTVLPFDI